jgi:hypothetical protein
VVLFLDQDDKKSFIIFVYAALASRWRFGYAAITGEVREK